MKAITALVLTIAAFASAAPSAERDAVSARQECTYDCSCQDGAVPGTSTCCVSGTLGGTVRSPIMSLCNLESKRAKHNCHYSHATT